MSKQFQNKISKSQKEEKSISLTQIHDHSVSCLGTGTSIKSGGVKLVNLPLVHSLKKATNNLNEFESANTKGPYGD